jgi:hypothetical protein
LPSDPLRHVWQSVVALDDHPVAVETLFIPDEALGGIGSIAKLESLRVTARQNVDIDHQAEAVFAVLRGEDVEAAIGIYFDLVEWHGRARSREGHESDWRLATEFLERPLAPIESSPLEGKRVLDAIQASKTSVICTIAAAGHLPILIYILGGGVLIVKRLSQGPLRAWDTVSEEWTRRRLLAISGIGSPDAIGAPPRRKLELVAAAAAGEPAVVRLYDHLADDSRTRELLEILPRGKGKAMRPVELGALFTQPLRSASVRAVLRNAARGEQAIHAKHREVVRADFDRYEAENAGRYYLTEGDWDAPRAHRGI